MVCDLRGTRDPHSQGSGWGLLDGLLPPLLGSACHVVTFRPAFQFPQQATPLHLGLPGAWPGKWVPSKHLLEGKGPVEEQPCGWTSVEMSRAGNRGAFREP